MTNETKAEIRSILDVLNKNQLDIALSTLKAIQNAPKAQKHPFNSICNIKRQSAADGQSIATLQAAPHLNNTLKILHGGAAFTLADAATGMAAYSILDHAAGEDCVTQDLHYRFLRPAVNGTIIAKGSVIRKGKRTVVVEAKIYADDKLVGVADGTYIIIRPESSG
ncbi:MAG: PaaI family thioesterase [Chloroflexota bacterium]